jgi:hypothetical protein
MLFGNCPFERNNGPTGVVFAKRHNRNTEKKIQIILQQCIVVGFMVPVLSMMHYITSALG